MNLYIETENGVTKNHPAFEDNLMQAFGAIPEHWQPFTRITLKDSGITLGMYQKGICTYTSSDGNTWQDTWSAVEMTEEEKAEKVAQQTDYINRLINSLREKAQHVITTLTDETQIGYWNTFLSLLNAVTFTDPTQVMFPKLPKNNDGVYTDQYVDGVWQTRSVPL